MEKEDLFAWAMREQENVVCEKNKNQQFKVEILKQKQEWSEAIEMKQAQFNQAKVISSIKKATQYVISRLGLASLIT